MNTTESLPDSYYQNVSNALAEAGAYRPTLVVDKQHLDHNIDQLMAVIKQGFNYRIVAKSLPSLPFLQYIMARTNSQRLMSFHLPFLIHVAHHLPLSDILLGKPMPTQSARQFYDWHNQLANATFDPQHQLQWLIDSVARLQQYQALANELNTSLNINLEIDIGLHRGGFDSDHAFREALQFINASDNLKLSGLMGYEAHISKIPAFLGGSNKALAQAKQRYRHYVQLIKETLGEDALAGLTLNTGGSTTYPLYASPLNTYPGNTHPGNETSEQTDQIVNEIATSSALVKPTDFDLFTLDHHLPAAFIATPVLKTVNNPEIPMATRLSGFLRSLGLLPKKACFIYGGNWLAKPCYPKGAKLCNILGHSSNQEMYQLNNDSNLAVDDFLFFRPTQSEAVFLQFGEIAVYDNGKIVDWWSIFQPPSNMHETHIHETDTHEV